MATPSSGHGTQSIIGCAVIGSCLIAEVRRRRTARMRQCAMGFVLLWACGCGKGPPLAPVSGLVTLDKKPLAGASVVFQPVAPAGSTIAGKGSAAFCDAEGRFRLETTDGRAGAVIGDHRVRIYGPRKTAPADSKIDGAETSAAEVVPRKYNFETTLTFAVPRDGTSSADFELKTKD